MVFPIKEIAEIARENEIITAIDGAHGFGALKLDMKDLGVDMYASCGHKWLLGPAGTAALFISKDIIDKITPIHVGAYSADGFELNEKAQKMDAYSKTGHQFFYGTQGKALFSGMEAAAKFMDQIGMYEVEARIATLNNLLYEGLSNMGPKIQVLTPSEEKSRHCMVSFKHSELGYREMGTIMAKNGFRIRMVPESNVNAVRVSTHIYNSEKEIYAFLKLIEDQIL